MNTYSTDPNLADSDGDFVSDGEEIAQGTDPNLTNAQATEKTISFQNGVNRYTDANMRLLFSMNPYYMYNDTWAGRVGEYSGTNRLVIRLDNLLGQIPSEATIQSAQLRLFQYVNNGKQEIAVYGLTTPYDQETVCWSSPWREPGTGELDRDWQALDIATIDRQNDVWRNWDVTPYIEQLLSGERDNFGFLLRARNEANSIHSRFKCDHDPDEALRPQLEVVYTD